MVDRTLKIYKHTCMDCGKTAMLKYTSYWYRISKHGTGKCNPCSRKGGNSGSFQKGLTSHNKGQVGYGKWPKWYPKGALNPAWKGGKAPEGHKIRKSEPYKKWRTAVFERDNFTCQHCGIVGGSLHADHIKPFAHFPELRFEIDNGQTLCKPCHMKTDTYLSGARKYAVVL